MNSPELSDIIRDGVARGNVSASREQWRVLNAITLCRTPLLGGHLYVCSDCGKEKTSFNSCRNRHCPKCQGSDTAKWLTERLGELLPVPYFHVVFTIPHELGGITLQNKKVIYDILFQATAKTLGEVAQRKLGGKIGFLGVLHTWGQKLEAHPYIHCVVPGIVMKNDGTVKKSYDSFFLPQKILKVVFRAMFLKLLKKAYLKLEFHGEQEFLGEISQFDSLLTRLTKKHWICYLKKPFSGAEAVFKYLANYTHRVAISNNRIKALQDGTVTFTYKDYSDNCTKKRCSLNTSEFVRRFLLHILPKNFTRIRHFGFLGNRVKKDNLALLRKTLGDVSSTVQPPKPPACPHCGSLHLRLVSDLKPQHTYFPHSKSHTNGELPLVA